MFKKEAGNDKQGKDAGNRTLCPYRNFSQAINTNYKISVIISISSEPGVNVLKSILIRDMFKI